MKCGDIIGTHGKSIVSEAIQWYTHSKYSHIRVAINETEFIEATWPRVRKGHISEIKGDYDVKTPIDPLTPEEQEFLVKWLHEQIGKKYDWRGLLSFIIRKDVNNKIWFFCNEMAEELYIAMGKTFNKLRKLVGGDPAWHTPDDLMHSLLLKEDK